MPTQISDDELDKFEEDLRVIKNKYDQFFAGIMKLPPMTERRRIEAMIHELGKQKMRDNARRFRYQTLLSRYNQYREMWARKMREREEGPIDFRRRQAALRDEQDVPPPPPPPAEVPRARVTSSQADPYVKLEAGSNGDAMRRLYEEVRSEHLKLGKLPSLSYEQMADMIQKQSAIVRERYHVHTVAFRVETVDGKVKLKAKPVQE